MSMTQEELINLCKQKLEEKYSIVKISQRELEQLAIEIKEKSGVTLSLSTLKRLWKNSFKQSPQLATLNALANTLDYKDWRHFKEAHSDITKPTRISKFNLFALLVSFIVGAILTFTLVKSFTANSSNNQQVGNVAINGDFVFNASKTVSKGTPNTVVFNYDVSEVDADSFFIQQSWDPRNKVKIDDHNRTLTSIYYESGYHRARLIANDSVIAMAPVHILSDGWEPLVYLENEPTVPVSLKGQDIVSEGLLRLTQEHLNERGIKGQPLLYTRLANSKKFNVHSSNFGISTRIKLDSMLTPMCPFFNLIVVTEVNIFNILLGQFGCESLINYKLGEVSRSGSDHDLTRLGCNLYEWQELEISVKDKHASIVLNKELTYEEDFEKDFGDIVALIFVFDGIGSIDFVSLKDSHGISVYQDDFEES